MPEPQVSAWRRALQRLRRGGLSRAARAEWARSARWAKWDDLPKWAANPILRQRLKKALLKLWPWASYPSETAICALKQSNEPTMSTPENDPKLPTTDEGAVPVTANGAAPVAPVAVHADDSAPPSTEQRLAALEAKHTEVADAYLRAKAEAENTRRRAEDEISKARKFAIEAFAESMLPVKDSLEAAVAMPDAKLEVVLEGVHATLRQLTAALERNKVLDIAPPVGTKFDPHQHQAISVVPADQDANTVVSVLQKGYLIVDRVLRPALVTVAAPK